MKNKIAIILLVFVGLFSCNNLSDSIQLSASNVSNEKNKINFEITDSTRFFIANELTKISYTGNYPTSFPIIAIFLEESVRKQNEGSKSETELKIIKDVLIKGRPKSYFKIDIGEKITTISAAEDEGLHNGINYFRKLILEKSGKIPLMKYEDFSAIENRTLHLVMRNDSIEKFYSYIDSARYYNYNKIILEISNQIDLQFFNRIEVTKKKLNRKDFLKFIDYTIKSGFDIIPEIKLLTKQKKTFSNKYPELLFNDQTYDPRNSKVYEKIFQLIDEVITLIPCNSIHIGHDEVYGFGEKEAEKKIKILPASLFAEDVNILFQYLKSKNKKTLIWGDMIWSRKEFPNERGNKLSLENYENVVNLIPREIIICDWHYKSKFSEFPTFKKFDDLGFEVWGATWDDLLVMSNFTAYAKKQKLKKEFGMIATTWNRDIKTVYEIIRKSGKKFWNE